MVSFISAKLKFIQSQHADFTNTLERVVLYLNYERDFPLKLDVTSVRSTCTSGNVYEIISINEHKTLWWRLMIMKINKKIKSK